MADLNQSPIIYNKNNPLLGLPARKIWSLLRPQDVAGGRMVRKGRDFDGGYVMLDHGLKNATAYSLGINDDVSWDMDMVKLGCDVYQYDHTIDALPYDHPRMHWHKIGIADRMTEDPTFATIAALIERNGHESHDNLIVKMDIEGTEWALLQTIAEKTLLQFSQIIIEFHWMNYIDETFHVRRFVNALETLNRTHQLVHLHANNCGGLILAGGVILPETFEVTYVRRRDHTFVPCTKVFPTELDMPCNHAAADYFLGAIGFL